MIKLLPIVVFALLLSLCAPLSVSTYAVTEDDGWTEGDYQGSQEEQEQQAQDDWEDAGRPGDNDNDNDDDNNDNNNDGPKPYCDKVDWKVECHDRYDFYEGGPNTGLYPCNDGKTATNPLDCKDATEDDNDNDNNNNSGSSQQQVTQRSTLIPTPKVQYTVKQCLDLGWNDGLNAVKFNDTLGYNGCPYDPQTGRNAYAVGYGYGVDVRT